MDHALPNTPWIDSPLFERELAASDLDAETKRLAADFARDGFLLIDLGLPDLDALAESIVSACSAESAYTDRLQDAWERIEPVRTLACAPRALELMQTLFGRAPIPMQTLNFGTGTEQRAHSDAIHFHCHPSGFMCGVWVALEDIDEDNGPLKYYPGSHRLPYVDHTQLGKTASRQKHFEFYAEYEELLQRLIAELGLERKTLTVPRGTALLWHGNLLHGGQPVKDKARTRHSQVTHYYFEGCSYYQPQKSDALLGKVEHLYKRDVRTGRVIPHVYNGEWIRRRQVALRDWAYNSRLGKALLGLRRRG